jgi:thioglycine synthase
MEAVEYYSAETLAERCILGRWTDITPNAVDPEELILPEWSRNVHNLQIQWIQGWDLMQNNPVWVPANAVFFPYVERNCCFLFMPTTNGLASGNTVEEAVCHGLAELIERDAWSLVTGTINSDRSPDCPCLDQKTIPKELRSTTERFRACGVELFVRVITSDIGVPAFYACTLEKHGEAQFLAHEGMGAHPDARVALMRAITEVAQSRAADIQGSREDLTFWRARAMKRLNGREWIFQNDSMVCFDSLSTFESSTVLGDIHYMQELLLRIGIRRVIGVDLTRPDVRVPVVRVIVPGLESHCVDKWRAGKRLLSRLIPTRDSR